MQFYHNIDNINFIITVIKIIIFDILNKEPENIFLNIF